MCWLTVDLGSPSDLEAAEKCPERTTATNVASRSLETLVDCKKDVPAAIRVLEDFLAKHPDVAGRTFADARLQKMRALLTPCPVH